LDVLDALATVIGSAGHSVVTRQGPDSVDHLAAFIREQDPRVVIFDLGPPPTEIAVEKWRELCQQHGAHRPYVLTTTTACTLDPHPCMLEAVLLQPLALGDVIAAIRRAMATSTAVR
ncbi:MAG TPA: hypothetical protein VF765_09610, partial [Polyangiaceae bacterium]